LAACRGRAAALDHAGEPRAIIGMNFLKRPAVLLILVIIIAFSGLLVFLATWDIPAPTARIEKVIPNERLPR
jgi:hypothetical protein